MRNMNIPTRAYWQEWIMWNYMCVLIINFSFVEVLVTPRSSFWKIFNFMVKTSENKIIQNLLSVELDPSKPNNMRSPDPLMSCALKSLAWRSVRPYAFLSGKKVKVSIRFFYIFERNMIFIFLWESWAIWLTNWGLQWNW